MKSFYCSYSHRKTNVPKQLMLFLFLIQEIYTQSLLGLALHSCAGNTTGMLEVIKTSNPQPIGFRGNLLVKRPKFFYCTYSLGITETS